MPALCLAISQEQYVSYVHHGVVKDCPWGLEEAPSNLVVLTLRPSVHLAAQKFTHRSASSTLSSLGTSLGKAFYSTSLYQDHK